MKRELGTLEPLLARARELPFTKPTHEQVEEMRTTVLAMMPARATVPRRAVMRIALGGIAVAATVIVLLRGSPTVVTPARHAALRAIGPAVFVQTSPPPDEVVRLVDGTLHIDVSRLAPGERCRVISGDAEVEVRGTAFDVEVRHDRLERVVVEHGRVEVRTRNGTRILHPGQHWDAPREIIATAAPPRQLPPSPVAAAQQEAIRVRPLGRPWPRDPEPRSLANGRDAELAFRIGWDALDSGDAGAAAVAFHRATTIDPQGNIADDAAYWRAVALTRANRPESARNAFEAFLAEFPHSLHRGDALVTLGWLLAGAGELDSAREQFVRAAAADSSARVRENARTGLVEVATRLTSSQ